MKKIVIFLMAVLMLGLCGCQKQQEDADSQTTQSTQSTEKQPVDVARETLTQKLIREIEGAYIKDQEKPEFGTTAGMSELSYQYAEKWEQVADKYYNKLMAHHWEDPPNDIFYTSDEMHGFLSDMKENWEKYYQVQTDNYQKVLVSFYTTGTIVGPLMAAYEYEMKKDWALQVVDMCEHFYLE